MGNVPALAQAMVKMLEGDRPPEEALRYRAAWFSCERAADPHVELFEQVAANVSAWGEIPCSSMLKKVKAGFNKGALAPLEPVDIAEGEVLIVTLDIKPNLSTERLIEGIRSTAGVWQDDEYWEKFQRTIYEDRIRGARSRELPKL